VTTVGFDGASFDLVTGADGGPVAVLDRPFRGLLSYRTGPGATVLPLVAGGWPTLPAEASALADRVRPLTAIEAGRRVRNWVARRVVYDASIATVERHRSARRDGLGFAERCLVVGAGDCDVQNALVAAILSEAGFAARLAVGWVGSDGVALPGLHAWVEVAGEDGVRRVIDASDGGHVAMGGRGGTKTSQTAGSGPIMVETVGSTAARQASKLRFAWAPVLWVAGLATLGVAAWFVASRRLVVRRARPTRSPDLAGLIRGVLVKPDAYSDVPWLLQRRVVPVIDGPAISLSRALALSKRGRLAVCARDSELARKAVMGSVPVVDGGRPEGRAVATVLGAVDLERWDRALRNGQTHPVCQRVEQAAAIAGERWQVRLSPESPGEVAVLDGRLAGLGGRHLVATVDPRGELWRRFGGALGSRPAAMALVLAERVVANRESRPDRAERLLRQLAVEAVLEQTDRAP
jgi:hypothetical protein